jgi:hypothetical protein
MNLSISYIITRPELDLRISYQLLSFLESVITNEILLPINLYNPNDNFTMISIVPKALISDGKITEYFDAKNQINTFFFNIPFKDKLHTSTSEYFINVFFILLEEFFNKKKIKGVNYELLKHKVLIELKNKPELYEFTEPDDNGLSDILKELGLK